MKTPLLLTSVCTVLLASVGGSALAANPPAPLPPKHYYHNFVATNGTNTVTNQNGVLLFSGVNKNGQPVTDVPVDSSGNCLTSAKHVFINSVKYLDATKLFVAAGYADLPVPSGEVYADSHPTQSWFCTSKNGDVWNVAGKDSSTDPKRLERFMDIDYGDGFYFAVGQRGAKALVKVLKAQKGDVLTDKPWLEIPTADGANAGFAINSVTFGVNKFVAAANDSSIYLFVAPNTPINNSAKWVSNRPGNYISGSADFNQIIYAKDKNMFVLIGKNSTALFSNAGDEGVVWETATFPTRYGRYNHADLNQIVYVDNMFVVAADSGSIFQSPDGVNWNAAEGVNDSVNLNQITYSKPEFKALGVDDTGKESTWFATNGLNWNRSKFPYLYVKDSAGYNILGAVSYEMATGIIRSSYEGASLGGYQTIGPTLQPVTGLKKGDRICVSAVTGDPSVTDFYFELEDDAISLANTTVVWTEGTIYNPSSESVRGLKLINTLTETNDKPCGSIAPPAKVQPK